MTIKDQPWFAAADVCEALGFVRGGRSLTYLSVDETKVVPKGVIGSHDKGNPNAKLISESGIYKLILRSNKQHARDFQNWVTRDVLPAILAKDASKR